MLDKELMKTLLEALPKASKEQRVEIIRKCKLLDSFDDTKGDIRVFRTDPVPVPNEFIFDGMIYQLSAMGLMLASSASTLRRTRGFKVYAAKVPAVAAVLLADRNRIPNDPASKISLGRLAAKCLSLHLQTWATVSPALMLMNVDKIPEALDRQFPGYLESGLLAQLILRQKGTGFKLTGNKR